MTLNTEETERLRNLLDAAIKELRSGDISAKRVARRLRAFRDEHLQPNPASWSSIPDDD